MSVLLKIPKVAYLLRVFEAQRFYGYWCEKHLHVEQALVHALIRKLMQRQGLLSHYFPDVLRLYHYDLYSDLII